MRSTDYENPKLKHQRVSKKFHISPEKLEKLIKKGKDEHLSKTIPKRIRGKRK
jgi:K+-transporting ATPase c subunit